MAVLPCVLAVPGVAATAVLCCAFTGDVTPEAPIGGEALTAAVGPVGDLLEVRLLNCGLAGGLPFPPIHSFGGGLLIFPKLRLVPKTRGCCCCCLYGLALFRVGVWASSGGDGFFSWSAVGTLANLSL